MDNKMNVLLLQLGKETIVNMNGHNSHFLQVTCCAPQGSILVLCTERKYRPIYNEIY